MKLFIANSTRSRFVLNVRVPEIQKIMRLEIPSGHQCSFPIDMNQGQLDDVLKQLERYGARKRESVHGKLQDFTGLVYSLDKPISADEIKAGNEQQLDAAQDRSVKQATRSALAAELSFRDPKAKSKRSAKSVGVEVLKKESARSDEVPMMSLEISENGSQSARLPM